MKIYYTVFPFFIILRELVNSNIVCDRFCNSCLTSTCDSCESGFNLKDIDNN
jgi:hypothetical protein